MRPAYIIFAIIFIIASCQTAEEKEKWAKLKTQEGSAGAYTNESVKTEGNNNQSGNKSQFWEELVWKNIIDNKGVVLFSQPIPESWKFSTGSDINQPVITGPNNLKIYMLPFKTFMYYSDQFMQQSAAQSGMNLRRMPPVENIIEQDIMPIAQQRGLTFVRQYELPDIAKVEKWYKDQLYKVGPSREITKSIGTEWKDANGNPSFIIVNIGSSEDQSSQFWNYSGYILESNPNAFESARKQLAFTLANTQYNLAPIQEYNAEEARKAGISWAAHNQKMAANQASFQAQQRAYVNKTEAINNTIMEGYKSRDAASDRNQDQFLNTMKEQTNVVDHSTGKEYKVQSHYNKYWMNSNGEYISTDQHTYDPNADVNMNRQKWEELHKND